MKFLHIWSNFNMWYWILFNFYLYITLIFFMKGLKYMIQTDKSPAFVEDKIDEFLKTYEVSIPFICFILLTQVKDINWNYLCKFLKGWKKVTIVSKINLSKLTNCFNNEIFCLTKIIPWEVFHVKFPVIVVSTVCEFKTRCISTF